VSARDEVLAAVRAALEPSGGRSGPADDVPPRAAAPTPGPAVDRAALLDLFAERVADYRAEVTRCPASDLPGVVVAALAGAHRVVVPAGLGLEVPLARVDEDLTAADLDATDAVVTAAAVGIAETGTVVLDHGPGQGRRVISLLPDLHVCLVRESQVVSDVPDALALLDAHRPQTWVSGPSATSDIELSRVEGVHGPRRLEIVIVT
jgi:L-lactate dehydrogenase complex protein LldG